MKKLLVTLLLTAVASSAPASSLPDFPFVFAEGEAEVESAPDIAVIEFEVTDYSGSAEAAVAVVTTRCGELLSYFLEQEIDRKDIETYELRKNMLRDYDCDRKYLTVGYEVHRSFTITLHELDNYGRIFEKLMNTQNVDGIRANFDCTLRKEIEAELLSKACGIARDHAEQLATGFGRKLGDLFAVSREGFWRFSQAFGIPGGSGGSRGFQASSTVSVPEQFFVPSTIKFSANVAALFKLGE
jgi:uncharacterized protein YggE